MRAPWLTAKTGEEKGPIDWKPQAKRACIARDVLDVVEMLRAADALPVGPRTIGYRLSMRDNASGMRYRKVNPGGRQVRGWATFEDIVVVVKKLRQCGLLSWEDISDGSAVHHPVHGFHSLEDWLNQSLDPEAFERDLRFGQPVVAEVYVESAELTPLIARVASEFGVRTYSGRGSAGPDLALGTASRIAERWNESRTRTLILGIGDLDHSGVQNVMRPHVEHVGAFLLSMAKDDFDTAAHLLDFRRIAITPEQAIDANDALGIPLGSLEDYRDSGECDWSRDVRLLHLCPKTETEALDPATLRDLIQDALEDVLDLDVLANVRRAQERERLEIAAIREGLGLAD